MLRFHNFMNLSAPEQVAVQIIQIYLLFSRSLGGFQYFRIERIISGDWSRKYDKCYCHKMIMIQIFRYYLYLYLLPLLFATLQVEGRDYSLKIITEKAPTRAFSWLKAPTSIFDFKTLC